MVNAERNRIREISRDFMVLLIICMIGTLVRLPLNSFASVDVTRLTDPDSYFYARKAVEAYNMPVPEWSIYCSRAEDPTMNYDFTAMLGKGMLITYSLIVALICKVFPLLDVNTVIYYFATFLCPLSSVPTFFFLKKRVGFSAAVFGGLLMSVCPAYFMHTTYGMFDTDAIIMVLATSFMLCHIETLLETNPKKRGLYGFLSIGIIALFSIFWTHFFVYAALAVFLTVVYCVYLLVKKINKADSIPEERSFNAGTMIPLASSIIIFLFASKPIVGSVISVLSSLFSNNTSFWPDPGKYVQELKNPVFFAGGINASFYLIRTGFINWLGGFPAFILFVFIIIFFVAYSILKKKKTGFKIEGFDATLAMLLFAWGVPTFILSFTGIRYVQLFALPFSLLCAYIIGIFLINPDKRIKGVLKYVFIILLCTILFEIISFESYLLCLLITIIVFSIVALKDDVSFKKILIAFCTLYIFLICYNEGKDVIPAFISDEVADATEYLVNNNDEDYTVVCDWGNGYYEQYATGQQVIADGGTYSGEYYVFFEDIFTTDDPKLARGIANMLQSGNLDALDYAIQYTGSDEKALILLKDILSMSKEEARETLASKYGFSNDSAQELILLSHPVSDKPIYIFFTKETVEYLSSIAYYGLWDTVGDHTLTVSYDPSEKKYSFSPELEKSLYVRWFNGEKIDGFTEFYRNDGVTVFLLNDTF